MNSLSIRAQKRLGIKKDYWMISSSLMGYSQPNMLPISSPNFSLELRFITNFLVIPTWMLMGILNLSLESLPQLPYLLLFQPSTSQEKNISNSHNLYNQNLGLILWFLNFPHSNPSKNSQLYIPKLSQIHPLLLPWSKLCKPNWSTRFHSCSFYYYPFSI